MNSVKRLAIGILFILFFTTGCDDSSNNPLSADDDNNNNNNNTSWTAETVAAEGAYPALVLDSKGNAHLSYLDMNEGYVKYARGDGQNWVIETVAKVSNSNGTFANGGMSSVAVNAADEPCICYYDYGDVQFRYASKSTDNWTIVSIPLPMDPKMSYDSPFIPWAESSIIVDKQSGDVHIAMQMLGGWSGYVLGYWRSGMNAALIVDDSDANTGYNNSIALDNNGNPVITYEARVIGQLKCARWNGSGFDKETIAAMPNMYWMQHLSSLALDSLGVCHVAFYGQNGYKYARWNGSWEIKDIAFQSGYPALSLSLDKNCSAQIALVTIDYGNSYRLKQAFMNGTDWSYQNIEDNISDCAIACGSNSKMAVAYETNSGELKFAYK